MNEYPPVTGSRKIPLGTDVLTVTRQRIADTFDQLGRICLSFSGGKDSTVMLHLVAEEACRRGRRFSILFIDYKVVIETMGYTDDDYWVLFLFLKIRRYQKMGLKNRNHLHRIKFIAE
ncbi:hypothetical protein DPB93_24420 [Salmonella enterica subsp. salamae]|nr:hypothetical protein [Salmonella enterica subsp. salamae]ECI4078701.1 hypothetical protein [Salmonella enterica subsp. salamae]EEO2383764.1 phosphoadenosine phosphosulfate reductase family protein [Salmonella enterica]